MAVYPTPEPSTFSKVTAGLSDTTIVNNVYKFMGCSVVSCNMTLGFNGTPGSLNVNLIEDLENHDAFIPPAMPSAHAFSLPKGGTGKPIFVANSFDFNPDDFNPTNVPFYFCGICTSWQKGTIDIGGRTIQVNLVDPRELLSGVQCLLGGFALSQNIGGGSNRYDQVNNVIDVFGYFNYGMESGKNEYGMVWDDIKTAIEATRVRINDIYFEFTFTGETFTSAPNWYRIDENIIDLMALCQRVADDAGSDFIVLTRKVADNYCLVEFRGVKRTNVDLLLQTEIDDFIAARPDLVISSKQGKEYRNEPTSSIIVGGMRNANYTAYPSTFDSSMHYDYNAFPTDLKVRLFGGSTYRFYADDNGSHVTSGLVTYNVDSGAIFPFWGFTPDDQAYPLIEPFLPLDHLVFDLDTSNMVDLKRAIPYCKVDVGNFTVRNRTHDDMFLDGDGDPDSRPFAKVASRYVFSATSPGSGYMKGLPLNTEVLRAALQSRDAFFSIYALYYPDIAASGGFGIDFKALHTAVQMAISGATVDCDVANFSLDFLCHGHSSVLGAGVNINWDNAARAPKPNMTPAQLATGRAAILSRYLGIIHSHVRQYALDHMGRKFLVALPRSEIMNRIWTNLDVPTNPLRPTIEYTVDNRGYWENIPPELDGIENTTGTSGTFSGTEEDQIRRKFMSEDNRFYAMVGIDWHPSGNVNYNSDGINRAMFQDFPVSEFRPNKIASGNPRYILASCSVNQLVKRPDLALVELPAAIQFDPTDFDESALPSGYFRPGQADDEFIATKAGIIKYFWYFYKRNNDFRDLLKEAAGEYAMSVNDYASYVITKWADRLKDRLNNPFQRSMSTEFVMDLKGVIVPLTSTWVSYGPWYSTYDQANGMVKIEIDESLVPWNFDRPVDPNPWYTNLDVAGFERLSRTIADVDYVDNASITVAGFPEYGPGSAFGYNSNITSISVDFAIGGVTTSYNFSTFLQKPGTYRKSDYDNVSRARIDTREKLPDTENFNIISTEVDRGYGTNRFRY